MNDEKHEGPPLLLQNVVNGVSLRFFIHGRGSLIENKDIGIPADVSYDNYLLLLPATEPLAQIPYVFVEPELCKVLAEAELLAGLYYLLIARTVPEPEVPHECVLEQLRILRGIRYSIIDVNFPRAPPVEFHLPPELVELEEGLYEDGLPRPVRPHNGDRARMVENQVEVSENQPPLQIHAEILEFYFLYFFRQTDGGHYLLLGHIC